MRYFLPDTEDLKITLQHILKVYRAEWPQQVSKVRLALENGFAFVRQLFSQKPEDGLPAWEKPIIQLETILKKKDVTRKEILQNISSILALSSDDNTITSPNYNHLALMLVEAIRCHFGIPLAEFPNHIGSIFSGTALPYGECDSVSKLAYLFSFCHDQPFSSGHALLIRLFKAATRYHIQEMLSKFSKDENLENENFTRSFTPIFTPIIPNSSDFKKCLENIAVIYERERSKPVSQRILDAGEKVINESGKSSGEERISEINKICTRPNVTLQDMVNLCVSIIDQNSKNKNLASMLSLAIACHFNLQECTYAFYAIGNIADSDFTKLSGDPICRLATAFTFRLNLYKEILTQGTKYMVNNWLLQCMGTRPIISHPAQLLEPNPMTFARTLFGDIQQKYSSIVPMTEGAQSANKESISPVVPPTPGGEPPVSAPSSSSAAALMGLIASPPAMALPTSQPQAPIPAHILPAANDASSNSIATLMSDAEEPKTPTATPAHGKGKEPPRRAHSRSL